MKIDERAQEWATETILSDLGGMEWDKIIEEMEEGNIPEDVSVWEPFEDYDAERLLEIWESFRDQFTRYAKEITKELKK